MKATSALQSAALYQHAVFFHCFVNDSVQLGTVKVCWYSSHIYQSSARFQRLLAGFALLLLLAFSNAGQETCSSWKNKNTHTAADCVHLWTQAHLGPALLRRLSPGLFTAQYFLIMYGEWRDLDNAVLKYGLDGSWQEWMFVPEATTCCASQWLWLQSKGINTQDSRKLLNSANTVKPDVIKDQVPGEALSVITICPLLHNSKTRN